MSDIKKYTVADIDAIGDFIFKESNIGDKLVKIQKDRYNASGTETWVKKDKYYWDNNGYDVGNNELYNWLYKSLTPKAVVEIYTDGKEMKEDLTQYYGLNSNGDTVYVAMSAEEVRNYAKKHPEEDIVKIEDSNYNYHSLVESLKRFDRKEFDENCNTYELEMLFESAKTTLSAQQKNDLARFVRKAKTAEEVNTYMTGMLAQGQMNEAFDKPPHEFWYYTKHGLGPGTIPRDVTVLDVKEDDNWGTYIKLDKVLTTDELNKYEIKEKIPPNELTEEVDEESFNKLKEIAYELYNYIEDKVWIRDFWYDATFDKTITFSISGDWKHDHARFDYYAKEWLDNKGLDYKISQHITDDDGSDSYEADHTIRIYNL